MGLQTKVIEEEIELLKTKILDFQKKLSVSKQEKLKDLSKHKQLYENGQRINEETNFKIQERIERRMQIEKDIGSKLHYLNSQKMENKKIEEKMNYFKILKEFIDQMSPDFFKIAKK